LSSKQAVNQARELKAGNIKFGNYASDGTLTELYDLERAVEATTLPTGPKGQNAPRDPNQRCGDAEPALEGATRASPTGIGQQQDLRYYPRSAQLGKMGHGKWLATKNLIPETVWKRKT
jgi:hypothetical protein